ncbi:unnamed protein product [Didymodactylos carnosus]|uniref:Uncharacterized protein n=1 Tax=Didymodactylos carnosus TaxID=1234261 RepID=A0A815UAE8_9BILA|nr:unnamed protein product [Didymodactylos carnosus]CAF4376697.1 unnamed protein product [Didymodactylos carnosus]
MEVKSLSTETDDNSLIFQSSNQSSIALSTDYRSRLAKAYSNFEKLLLGDILSANFRYNGSREFRQPQQRPAGFITEGGWFNLFTVTTYMGSSQLPSGALAIILNRILETEKNPDPHFALFESDSALADQLFNYTDVYSAISRVRRSVYQSFQTFDKDLNQALNQYGFHRIN